MGGWWQERIEHLKAVIEDDIKRDLYLGCVIKVARHGEVAIEQAFGHADEGRKKPLALDSVFGALAGDIRFTTALRAAYAALAPATPDAVRRALTDV